MAFFTASYQKIKHKPKGAESMGVASHKLHLLSTCTTRPDFLSRLEEGGGHRFTKFESKITCIGGRLDSYGCSSYLMNINEIVGSNPLKCMHKDVKMYFMDTF